MSLTKIRPIKKNLATSWGAATSNIYTVGASLRSAINEMRLHNKTASAVVVDVELWPSNTQASNIVLVQSQTIPAYETFVFRGYRCMIDGDVLHAICDTGSAVDMLCCGQEDAEADSNMHQGLVRGVTNSGYDTLFTGPTLSAAVNDLCFVNKSGSTVTVSMQLWPLNVSGNAIQLVTTQSIRAGERYEPIGQITMLNTDTLKVQASASASVDAILSATQ